MFVLGLVLHHPTIVYVIEAQVQQTACIVLRVSVELISSSPRINVLLANINFSSIGIYTYLKVLFNLHAFVELLFDEPCLHIMMSLF